MKHIHIKTLMLGLCFLCMVCGCSDKANHVDPEEFIKTEHPETEQVAMTEEDGWQVRVVKDEDSYQLFAFRADADAYRFESGVKTGRPYILETSQRNGDFRVAVFLDNRIVQADSFSLRLNSLASENDYIVLHADGLLPMDDYILKCYHLPSAYHNMIELSFFDENGNDISDAVEMLVFEE